MDQQERPTQTLYFQFEDLKRALNTSQSFSMLTTARSINNSPITGGREIHPYRPAIHQTTGPSTCIQAIGRSPAGNVWWSKPPISLIGVWVTTFQLGARETVNKGEMQCEVVSTDHYGLSIDWSAPHRPGLVTSDTTL